MKINVWTLAFDDDSGTSANVYAKESHADAAARNNIEMYWEEFMEGPLPQDHWAAYERMQVECSDFQDTIALGKSEIVIPDPAPAQQTLGDAKERTEAEIEADKITRQLAGEEFGSDEIEIDKDAPVSRNEDGGAWVQAWLYVHPDAGKEDQEQKMFLNFYHCKDCDVQWQDKWSATCDDKCPECGKAYSPFKSEDADGEAVAA